MRVDIDEDVRLPRLGWIARVDPIARLVSVRHGASVERGDDWVVEGVWDAPFGPSFADAPHLFGSGLRVANGSVVFVPSAALVDRLLWTQDNGVFVVSNSLALLLASLGWRLTPGYNYVKTLYAITAGISTYDDRIPTSGGVVHQLYYRNLEVGGDGMQLRHKADSETIRDFAEYRALLSDAVQRLRENLNDRRRRTGVDVVATISRGYDSPAVCALARGAGLETCYTSVRSNSMIPTIVSRAATDDDGTEIATALGLRTRRLERNVDRELHFLAGSEEPELVFSQLARDIERSGRAAAVFSGYHGDMVWRVDAFDDDRAPEIIRHDISGQNLGEVRLEAGFFNVPLTFLHVRSQASIGRISRSAEMAPWRTFNEYDRPIPRRLLVEAGVDGDLFGRRKKAVVERPHWPATPALRREFLTAVHRDTGCSQRSIEITRALDGLLALPAAAFKRAGVRLPSVLRPADLRTRLYAWAVNALACRYEDAFRTPAAAARLRHVVGR